MIDQWKALGIYVIALLAGLFLGFAFTALGATAPEQAGIPSCETVLEQEDAANVKDGYAFAEKDKIPAGLVFIWAKTKDDIRAIAITPPDASPKEGSLFSGGGGQCLTGDGKTVAWWRGAYSDKGI